MLSKKFKLVSVRVLQGCDVSSGFPYWVFQYHDANVSINEDVKNG